MHIKQAISSTWVKVTRWRDITRQRRALGALDDQLLKDIGLSRVDAEREANRGFWDTSAGFDHTLRQRGEDMRQSTFDLQCTSSI